MVWQCHILSTHSSVDGYLAGLYFFWLWTFVNKILCECVFLFLVRSRGITGSHVSSGLNRFYFLRNHRIVLHSGCTFYIPTRHVQRSQHLHILASTCDSLFFLDSLWRVRASGNTFLFRVNQTKHLKSFQWHMITTPSLTAQCCGWQARAQGVTEGDSTSTSIQLNVPSAGSWALFFCF
jgi:hypothetical protein